MAAPSRSTPDDDTLAQYLLGTLPEAEAERLDELSIVDDDFASRLTAAEHELMDAYVRGEMSGSTLQQFQSRVLATPEGRQKVRFAQALASTAPARAAKTRSSFVEGRWMLAAAAVVLVAVGYLVSENVRLRRELAGIRAASAAVEQRADQLVAQLSTERQAVAETAKELARLRDSMADLQRRMTQSAPQAVIATFVLSPATRGNGGNTEVSLAMNTSSVSFQLPLEDDEFPQYDAAVIDSSTSATMWRSPRLKSGRSGTRSLVSVTVPAAVLKPGLYVLELNGLPAGGTAEAVNTYPFRVLRR